MSVRLRKLGNKFGRQFLSDVLRDDAPVRCPHDTSRKSFCTAKRLFASKKDYYKEDKLPIFDYGKLHPERKRLYVFGQAGHGGLGLQHLHERHPDIDKERTRLFIHRPVRHNFAAVRDVKDICTGQGFTLIAVKPKKDNDPVIYGCGFNHKSQLGFQPSVEDKPLICLTNIVPVALPLDKGSNVLALGAGHGHSLISVAGRGLIALGDNSRGQCGRKIIPDEEYEGSKYIYRIPACGPSSDSDVIQISSRVDVNICLTRAGTVFSFGNNTQGQLGRGKSVSKQWVPEQVAGDLQGVRVKKVVTSGVSSLAISDKGELFGWGSNDCGQINPETHSDIYFEPRRVKLARRVGKIIDVAIGDMFTFVLNEYGNVYVWGMGGTLGLGPKNVLLKSPTLMPPPLFGRNEFAPDVAVVKIVSSFKYAAAVNTIGDLFTWGLSDHGCMGHGKIHKEGDYQYFPLKVHLGGPVHKVCLGTDHTVVMTRNI